MVSGINVSLPGVVLYEAFSQTNVGANLTEAQLRFVPDESADITNHTLFLGLPMLAAIAIGLIFVSYYTQEDGFVRGYRRIASEEKYTYHMYFYVFLIYVLEGTQYCALPFTSSIDRPCHHCALADHCPQSINCRLWRLLQSNGDQLRFAGHVEF